MLKCGDIFILDNFSVHVNGDNVSLEETLWYDCSIVLVNLSLYNPELNPSEVVFNTLLQRLSRVRVCYKSLDVVDCMHAIKLTMASFDVDNIVAFYKHCGYI